MQKKISMKLKFLSTTEENTFIQKQKVMLWSKNCIVFIHESLHFLLFFSFMLYKKNLSHEKSLGISKFSGNKHLSQALSHKRFQFCWFQLFSFTSFVGKSGYRRIWYMCSHQILTSHIVLVDQIQCPWIF